MTKAYLDIETTGLSPVNNYVTIVGAITKDVLKQFICGATLEKGILDEYIKENNITEVVGYNHIAFDNQFLIKYEYISHETLSNLKQTDLMHKCHKLGIMGGLKKTEEILGIKRKAEPLNFYQQIALWNRWLNKKDVDALNRYLFYNLEDILNLPKVEQALIEYEIQKKIRHEKFMKVWKAKRKEVEK